MPGAALWRGGLHRCVPCRRPDGSSAPRIRVPDARSMGYAGAWHMPRTGVTGAMRTTLDTKTNEEG